MQLCSTRLSTHKLCQMTGIQQKKEKCSLKALQFAFLKVPGETTWCNLHRWSVKLSIGLCLHLAATCNNSSCINGCERVHVRFQQTLIKKINSSWCSCLINFKIQVCKMWLQNTTKAKIQNKIFRFDFISFSASLWEQNDDHILSKCCLEQSHMFIHVVKAQNFWVVIQQNSRLELMIWLNILCLKSYWQTQLQFHDIVIALAHSLTCWPADLLVKHHSGPDKC